MTGYHEFSNYETFTAAAAQGLMDQGLIIVANSSARDAIANVTEGMGVYRLDTHRIERRSASAWVPEFTDWTAFSGTGASPGNFNTGWSAPANSNRRAGSVKRVGSRVYIEGVFTKGSTIVAGETMAVLPAGLVPTVNLDLPARIGTAIGQIFVRSTGLLTCQDGVSGGGSVVFQGGASWDLA